MGKNTPDIPVKQEDRPVSASNCQEPSSAQHHRKRKRLHLAAYLGLFLLFIGLLDFYTEMAGLPGFLCRYAERILEKKIPCKAEISTIYFGFFNGLRIENSDILIEAAEAPLRIQLNQLQIQATFPWQLPSWRHWKSCSLHQLHLVQKRNNQPPAAIYIEALELQQDGENGQGELRGTIFGIQTICDVDIQNTESLIQKLNSRIQNSNSSASWQETLPKIQDAVQQYQYRQRDSQLTLHGKIDGAQEYPVTLTGNFRLNEIQIPKFPVSQLSGIVILTGEELSFRRLNWYFSGNDQIEGQISLLLNSRKISADTTGKLTLLMLLNGTGLSLSPATLREITSLPESIHFHCNLPPSSWDLHQFRPTVELQVKRISLENVILPAATAKLHIEDQTLYLDDLTLALSEDFEKDQCRISGSYQLNQDLLSWNGDFSFHPFAEQQISTGLLGLAKHNTFAEAVWNGTFSGSLHPRTQALLKDAECSLELQSSPITVEGISLTDCQVSLQKQQEHVELKARGDLANSTHALTWQWNSLQGTVSQDECILPIQFQCSRKTPDHPELCRGESTVHWDVPAEKFSFTGKLRGYPDRILAAILSQFPETALQQKELVQHLKCTGAPLEMELSMQPTRHPLENYLISGIIRASDTEFDSFKIKKMQSEFQWIPGKFSLQNCLGETQTDATCKLNLEFQTTPITTLTIRDLQWTGDPMELQAFFFSKRAAEIWDDIWHPAEWESQKPTFLIPTLLYQATSPNSSIFMLQDATLLCKAGKYRGIPIQELQANCQLQLPGDLKFDQVKIQLPHASLTGECSFELTGIPQFRFDIRNCTGSLSSDELLAPILPVVADDLGAIRFDDGKFTCSGAFFLSGPSELNLTGTIDAPRASFRDLTLEQAKIDWNLRDDKIFWNLRQANTLQGKLYTTGTYDFHIHQGDLLVLAEKLNFRETLKQLKAEKLEEYSGEHGIMNLQANLNIKHDWCGKPWRLEGTGQLLVQQARLFQIPVFRPLNALLKNKITFGDITELTANIDCQGDQISITDFRTDGDLVSISGYGGYDLTTNNIHGEIEGHALRKVPILSFLFKPFTWAFQAEVSGTRQNPVWKMRNLFQRLLSF